jgi:hypothetical protein
MYTNPEVAGPPPQKTTKNIDINKRVSKSIVIDIRAESTSEKLVKFATALVLTPSLFEIMPDSTNTTANVGSSVTIYIRFN